ncbi:MAG: hypothetical protein JNM76_11150 [Betaproteobacteria bacterium]|nr:hypothetical protein [Betaproteobacteria bacterium]
MSTRNFRTLITTVAAASGLFIGFAAQAGEGKGDHGKHAMERLAEADKDGDGKLSKDEAAALPRLAKRFDQIDANKDGFITKEEMKAARQKHDGDRLARVDTDRSGTITRAEAERMPKLKENFDKLDTNKDGVLSKDELKAAHERKKPQT